MDEWLQNGVTPFDSVRVSDAQTLLFVKEWRVGSPLISSRLTSFSHFIFQYYRPRKNWLFFAFGAFIKQEEDSMKSAQDPVRKVLEISDLIRYLSEFL
jgi:hypothetical protein